MKLNILRNISLLLLIALVCSDLIMAKRKPTNKITRRNDDEEEEKVKGRSPCTLNQKIPGVKERCEAYRAKKKKQRVDNKKGSSEPCELRPSIAKNSEECAKLRQYKEMNSQAYTDSLTYEEKPKRGGKRGGSKKGRF